MRKWEEMQFKAHGITSSKAEQFLKAGAGFSYEKGWSLGEGLEKETYDSLSSIMNNIFAFFGIANRRTIVVANKAIPDEAALGAASAKPDIVIIGHDVSQLPKLLSEYDLSPFQRRDSVCASLRSILKDDYKKSLEYYPGCIGAGDINPATGGALPLSTRVRLAMYAA